MKNEWWQKFFAPIIGEIMFSTKSDVTAKEVQQVLKMSKVPSHAKILDLACGTGRHSILFAKQDYEVTGLDYASNFLAEARKQAKKSKCDVEFIRGDMKNLKPHFSKNYFDLVTSLYNSFGYFSKRSDDIKMLKEVYRVLRPGGKFVINTLNGDGVRKRIAEPVSLGREPIRGVFMIDAARYDQELNKTFSKWTLVDTRKSKTKIFRGEFQQNVYTHAALKSLLLQAGFKIETTWSQLPGGRFSSKESWHQTILAKKPVS